MSGGKALQGAAAWTQLGRKGLWLGAQSKCVKVGRKWKLYMEGSLWRMY